MEQYGGRCLWFILSLSIFFSFQIRMSSAEVISKSFQGNITQELKNYCATYGFSMSNHWFSCAWYGCNSRTLVSSYRSLNKLYCFCDKLCEEIGDCCYNYWERCSNQQTNQTTQAIIPSFTNCSKISGQALGILTTDRCLKDWIGPQSRDMCENNDDASDVFLQIPVFSFRTNRTFINIFCAVCNQEINEELMFWNVLFIPKKVVRDDIFSNRNNNLEETVGHLSSSGSYYLKMVPAEEAQNYANDCEPQYYHALLNSVHSNGSDHLLEHLASACHMYTYPCTDKATPHFKNPHCMHLSYIQRNEQMPATIKNIFQGGVQFMSRFSFISFVLKLHHPNFILKEFQNNRETEFSGEKLMTSDCEPTMLYDPFQKTCREVWGLEENMPNFLNDTSVFKNKTRDMSVFKNKAIDVKDFKTSSNTSQTKKKQLIGNESFNWHLVAHTIGLPLPFMQLGKLVTSPESGTVIDVMVFKITVLLISAQVWTMFAVGFSHSPEECFVRRLIIPYLYLTAFFWLNTVLTIAKKKSNIQVSTLSIFKFRLELCLNYTLPLILNCIMALFSINTLFTSSDPCLVVYDLFPLITFCSLPVIFIIFHSFINLYYSTKQQKVGHKKEDGEVNMSRDGSLTIYGVIMYACLSVIMAITFSLWWTVNIVITDAMTWLYYTASCLVQAAILGWLHFFRHKIFVLKNEREEEEESSTTLERSFVDQCEVLDQNKDEISSEEMSANNPHKLPPVSRC